MYWWYLAAKAVSSGRTRRFGFIATNSLRQKQGLVSVLREIHDDLDAATLEACGWPTDIRTEDILYLLVALNEAREAEERAGLIRWLRPDTSNLSSRVKWA